MAVPWVRWKLTSHMNQKFSVFGMRMFQYVPVMFINMDENMYKFISFITVIEPLIKRDQVGGFYYRKRNYISELYLSMLEEIS